MSALLELEQGTPEWLDFRKTKITATDAVVIMGASHYKTKLQLYKEKKSEEHLNFTNEAMQRGIDLEPIARDLFCLKTGHKMVPKVVVKDWAMASLDGINDWNEILEIKCPGAKVHSIALAGKVPDHYFAQLQHQMYVCDSKRAFYYSFDGFDGITIECPRDDDYIEKMIIEEKKFYDCLMNDTPPEPDESDYVDRDDELWRHWAARQIEIVDKIKHLEDQDAECREQLVFLSNDSNCRGGGISLCKVTRKGNVDYSKMIKELALDDDFVDKFRKPSSTSWRIIKCKEEEDE
jgi:putative phage-type endonuclease